jgi:hypothetical protein
LAESFDEQRGRYKLLMMGREKALGVKAERCKLEFAVEQERAAKRTHVEAQEPEPEPEPADGTVVGHDRMETESDDDTDRGSRGAVGSE